MSTFSVPSTFVVAKGGGVCACAVATSAAVANAAVTAKCARGMMFLPVRSQAASLAAAAALSAATIIQDRRGRQRPASCRYLRLVIWLAAEEACDFPGAPVLEVAQLLAADRQDGVDRHIADRSRGRQHLGKDREHRVGRRVIGKDPN